MAMELYLWKAPVVEEASEAAALVDRHLEADDKSTFEPSPDIAAFYEDLLELYPTRVVHGEEAVKLLSERELETHAGIPIEEVMAVEGGEPWSEFPFYQSDRLLIVSIRWKAGDGVIEDIMRLAEEHRLFLYDPQGPEVYSADSWQTQTGPTEPITLRQKLQTVPMLLFFLAITIGGWFIPWWWVRWPVMAIGAFFTIAAAIVVYAVFAEGDEPVGGKAA